MNHDDRLIIHQVDGFQWPRRWRFTFLYCWALMLSWFCQPCKVDFEKKGDLFSDVDRNRHVDNHESYVCCGCVHMFYIDKHTVCVCIRMCLCKCKCVVWMYLRLCLHDSCTHRYFSLNLDQITMEQIDLCMEKLSQTPLCRLFRLAFLFSPAECPSGTADWQPDREREIDG